jgi:hypothetical protein
MINFDIKEEGQKRNLYSLEIRIGLEGGPLPKGVGSGYGLPARLSSGPPFAPAPKNWLNGTDTKEYV